MSFSKEISKIIALLLINLLYASVGIFTKLASQYDFLSWSYIVFFGIAVGIIGIYAILWQQLIKRIDLTTACVFKGTGLIYAMLFAYFIFDEQISWNNILGVLIIITGIVLYAYHPKTQNTKH